MRRVAGRIWLDITGIRPGSDAAVFAAELGRALRQHGPLALVVCRRAPGMRVVGDDALDTLLEGRVRLRDRVRHTGVLRRLARGLPEQARLAVGRYVRLQRASVLAWRLAAIGTLRHAARYRAPRDRAVPAAGDVLLMLSPSGDAARFAHGGTRLVFLAAESAVLIRPDWLLADDAAAAAIWLRQTLPHVSRVIAFTEATAQAVVRAGCLPDPVVVTAAGTVTPTGGPIGVSKGGAVRRAPSVGGGAEVPARSFVLAAGEIGEAGHTRHLLLAWRLLLDRMPPDEVPVLLLAGPLGALVGDLLEQLRNSRMFGGHVQLVLHPGPEEISRLTRQCLFTIAIGHSAWGRAACDSLAHGVACLSPHPAPGAVAVDATSATALADAVRDWLRTPPRQPPPASRLWSDVAADVLSALRA